MIFEQKHKVDFLQVLFLWILSYAELFNKYSFSKNYYTYD